MSETAQALDASETAVGGVPGTAVEALKQPGRLGWFRRGGKPSRPAYSTSRRRSINPRRAQFSLLVVRGDGVRIVRFNFARVLAVAGVILLAGAASFVGALLHDWLHLRYLTRESRTFEAQIAEQRRQIADFNRRVAALRREVGAWRELHARIQEPFGPEAGRNNSDRGIGGATNRSEPFVSGTSVSEELNGLTTTIMEEGENLRALDRLMQRASKAFAALPSRWPVRGRVNSEYGNRKSPWTEDTEFHAGIDIGANRGTAVQAPAAGTVVFAGTAPEYGTTVIVDHGQDIKSLYGHLSQISVKQGQKVERGTLLAYTGNTGRSSGPHLHYEILVKGRPVNPRAYLWD
jgi:murein DD-endopeptidase MepM/ murein hydrolase activator NlpD